jgi:hypothetical protein
MLLVATAEVDANALANPFLIDVPPYRVEVSVDESGFWNEIKITKRVANWRDSLLHIVVHTQTPQPSANIRSLDETPEETNSEIEDLRDLLRHLESFCGYVFDVNYIDWRCPKLEWIPESEEEKAGLTVSECDIHRRFAPEPRDIDPKRLAKAVLNRAQMSYLDIPLSFFREGKADYRQGRYINAFFNFYFFIEGLYADGRSSEPEVIGRFLQSDQMKRAAELTVEHFESMTDPHGGRHVLNLRVFLRELGFAWNPEGLLHLLVRMRNLLHHYSHKSRGVRRGHPLNQAEYESLAALAMTLCVHCVTPLLTGEKPS